MLFFKKLNKHNIVEPVEVITKPLGKIIKKKPIKGEFSKLTVPQLRSLIAKKVENNNSLVAPKAKVKKAVLVDWLMN